MEVFEESLSAGELAKVNTEIITTLMLNFEEQLRSKNDLEERVKELERVVSKLSEKTLCNCHEKQSISSQSSQSISSQPPATSHQPPATSHKPPATSHQPSLVKKDSGVGSRQSEFCASSGSTGSIGSGMDANSRLSPTTHDLVQARKMVKTFSWPDLENFTSMKVFLLLFEDQIEFALDNGVPERIIAHSIANHLLDNKKQQGR